MFGADQMQPNLQVNTNTQISGQGKKKEMSQQDNKTTHKDKAPKIAMIWKEACVQSSQITDLNPAEFLWYDLKYACPPTFPI